MSVPLLMYHMPDEAAMALERGSCFPTAIGWETGYDAAAYQGGASCESLDHTADCPPAGVPSVSPTRLAQVGTSRGSGPNRC